MKSPTRDVCQKLTSVLDAFLIEIMPLGEDIKHSLNCYSNSAFPLRGYLAFIKSRDGDEIAITINIQKKGEQLIICSDIAGDNGTIVSDGPSLILPNLDDDNFDVEFNKWLTMFVDFLQLKKDTLNESILKLV